MWRSVLKVVAATALYAGVHTLLASRTAKRAAARIFGERNRNGLYRPFYNAQAVVTTAALAWYVWRLPDRGLYRVRGLPAKLMRLGQVACVLYLLYAARQIGYLKFAGATNLAAWLARQPIVLPEPEAQGPLLGRGGRMLATGPFRAHRHPLNAGFAALLWLQPHVTINFATFTAMTTLYTILGSLNEERRLRERYGAAYEAYCEEVPNFYMPSPARLLGGTAQIQSMNSGHSSSPSGA